MKWRKVRKGEIIILLSLCFLIFFPRREGNFSPNSWSFPLSCQDFKSSRKLLRFFFFFLSSSIDPREKVRFTFVRCSFNVFFVTEFNRFERGREEDCHRSK